MKNRKTDNGTQQNIDPSRRSFLLSSAAAPVQSSPVWSPNQRLVFLPQASPRSPFLRKFPNR